MNKCKGKIEFDYELLRLRIRAKFASEGQFAVRIGVRREYLSRKLNNLIVITSEEIIEWSEILDIPQNLIGLYFFTPKVANGN